MVEQFVPVIVASPPYNHTLDMAWEVLQIHYYRDYAMDSFAILSSIRNQINSQGIIFIVFLWTSLFTHLVFLFPAH